MLAGLVFAGVLLSDIARFPVYDLHSHTRASDGLLTPAALVQRAVEMRVGVLAITDHDSVAGVDEAQQTTCLSAGTGRRDW